MRLINFLQDNQTRLHNYALRSLMIVSLLALLGAQSITAQVSALSKPVPKVVNISYVAKEHPPAVATGAKAINMNPPKGSGDCEYGSCYYWATMADYGINAAGASVNIMQSQPKVGAKDYHSLAELAVESADGQQIVEIGWLVAHGINQDNLTHLFIYHWVNGVGTCYNGCGFVPTSTTYTAGGLIKVNAMGSYSIQYSNNSWVLTYDGTELGYFPESIWGGTFTNIGLVQTFGEVASSSPTSPHTQMGNGLIGTKSKADAISNFNLIGAQNTNTMSYIAAQAPAVYKVGNYKSSCKLSCGMTFGGPGY